MIERPAPNSYALLILALMTASHLCHAMDRVVFSVVLSPIKAELAFSDTEMGLLGGIAFAIFYATLGIPLARIADRNNQVKVLSLALMFWGAATAVCGAIQNFVQLFLCRIGVGAGESGCIPSAHSILDDYFPRERRAFVISVFQAGGSIGSGLGIAMAGYIADRYGWRWVFPALGAPAIFVGIAILLGVKQPEAKQSSERPALMDIASVGFRLMKQRSYIYILVAMAFAQFATQGIGAWLPTFFVRTHGLTLTQVGGSLGLSSAVGGIAGSLLSGYAVNRLARRDKRWEVWVPACTYSLAVPLYLIVLTAPADIARGVYFLALAAAMSGIGAAFSSIHSVVSRQDRATATSFVLLTAALIGSGLAPLASGALSDILSNAFGQGSLRMALIIMAPTFLIPVAFYLLASRSFRSDAHTLTPIN